VRAALLLVLAGCGATYTADDQAANTIAARHEVRQLQECASDDAGSCTPAMVRAHASLAYCANERELQVHGAPVPDAGVQCQPQ
jgi:hypothetical protein